MRPIVRCHRSQRPGKAKPRERSVELPPKPPMMASIRPDHPFRTPGATTPRLAIPPPLLILDPGLWARRCTRHSTPIGQSR